MTRIIQSDFLADPRIRVLTTWIWKLIGMGIYHLTVMSVIASGRFHYRLEAEGFIRNILYEIIFVGALPLLYTILSEEKWASYGIRKKNIVPSFSYSILFTGFIFVMFIIFHQLHPPPSLCFTLQFPWNIGAGLAGIAIWGPLEIFFVFWLIENTDRIFKSENRKISPGLILTVALFGLSHIVSTGRFMNVVAVTFIFFILSWIYRHTGNAIGPMIAWMMLNGQVRIVAQLLWQ